MFFRHFFDPRLAQASYLVGCQATGEALVIDANRDVSQYITAAAAEGLRITYVTETHIHADFVSGSRELAQRTGGRLLLSGEGGPEWQYAFAAGSGATLLHDGDAFMVGNLRLEVMHSPGHTPEHLSFVLTDTPASTQPVMIFTGDFVFVGDVGRPDLLEKAAKQVGTMEAGARTLWHSLERFRALPGHVQVWPGHGAGSACGKALGAVPSTTVGYEKLVNWGVAAPDEATFVRMVLEGQPEPPAYFAVMKRVNKMGPPILGDRGPVTTLDDSDATALLSGGAVLLDVRRSDRFAAGHHRGAINVPLAKSLANYAGSLVPYDTPIIIVAESVSDAAATRYDLALIGLDDVRGTITPSQLPLVGGAVIARLRTADAVAAAASGGFVLDVRGASEWEAGHVSGATLMPLPDLAARAGELPTDRPILVHCQSGVRSAMAVSYLQRRGFTAIDVLGGYAAWAAAGGPTTRA
jgi:hydroxyacylglutathione hydrolase